MEVWVIFVVRLLTGECYLKHYQQLSPNGTLIEVYEGSRISDRRSFLIAIKFNATVDDQNWRLFLQMLSSLTYFLLNFLNCLSQRMYLPLVTIWGIECVCTVHRSPRKLIGVSLNSKPTLTQLTQLVQIAQ